MAFLFYGDGLVKFNCRSCSEVLKESVDGHRVMMVRRATNAGAKDSDNFFNFPSERPQTSDWPVLSASRLCPHRDPASQEDGQVCF